MPNPTMFNGGFPPGMVPAGVMRVPSQEERDEVKRVQGLQVRTAAAQMATTILANERPGAAEWTALAKVIEEYIWGHDFAGDAAAPVLPG